MKRILYGAGLCLVLCFVFIGTAGATTVTKERNIAGEWLVASDDVVGNYENVTWRPPVSKDKRDIREEDLALVGINCTVARAICWRLDAGRLDGFDWDDVRDQLAVTYGRVIGQMVEVAVTGNVEAPECYSVTADVYNVYTRECYRVENGTGDITYISVLVPRDGMSVVFNEVVQLGLHSCLGAAPPQGALATCGSIHGRPLTGTPCLDPGRRTKKDPEDYPSMDEPAATSTWGRIKALYGN